LILCQPIGTVSIMGDAQRRLRKEIINLQRDQPMYYSIYVQPDNIFKWSANIHCLNDTRHRGKNYELEITIPPDYPFKPPSVKCLTQINIDCVNKRTQEFYIDILKDQWSPSFTIDSLLLSICSVITQYEPIRKSPRLNV
jgi:ubiquitin-protein ligase